MSPQEVRDIFEEARRLALDLRDVRERLDGLRDPLRGHDPSRIMAHGGSGSDPTGNLGTRAADAGADLSELEAACARSQRDVAELCSGVRQGFGFKYGCALEDRYIRCLSWENVGRLNGCSKNTVRRWADSAIEWISLVGPERARSGRGVAEGAEPTGRGVEG